MDPLSATGTLIAVLQISSAVISLCYEYRSSTKSASREIALISSELHSLRDVLESLLKLSETQSSPNSHLATFELLVKPDGPLLACKSELERLGRELEPKEGWRRVGRQLVWPLKEGEVRRAMGVLERLKGTMQLALSADQAVVSLGLRDDVEELTEMFEKHSISQTQQSLYEWLAAPDPYAGHYTNRKKSQVGTGTWMLSSKRYENWVLSPKSFMWLYGIPGSGKTVLCSTAIEQLVHYCKPLPGAALVFFYFDFNDDKKRSLDALIRSLVTQLSSQCDTIPQVLLELFESHKTRKRSIDIDILVEAFRELVRSFQNVYIALDALDESSECEEILRLIENIQDWSLSQVHIFVTSRQLSTIDETFEKFTPDRICLQESALNRDIPIYIEVQLANDKVMARWPPDVRAQVRLKLLSGEEGMFQWVVCQMDMLKRCLSIAALRKALAAPLPKTLDETYERILFNIDESHQLEVSRTLQVLTVTIDHLSLEQIVEILAVDLDSDPPHFDPDARLLDPRSILFICSSLVTTFQPRTWTNRRDAPEAALRLAHASVADYLTQGGTTGFHFSESSARQLFAQICLVYLLNPEFSDGHKRSKFLKRNSDFPFLQHAALYWPMYLDDGEEDMAEPLSFKTKQLIEALFYTRTYENGGNYSCWVGQLIPDCPKTVIQNTPPLYYAASFGLVEVVRFILDSEPNIDIDALGGRAESSPLHVAVYRDHLDVARLLLERGANPDLPNAYDETALHWATVNKNREIQQLLLDCGTGNMRQRLQVS